MLPEKTNPAVRPPDPKAPATGPAAKPTAAQIVPMAPPTGPISRLLGSAHRTPLDSNQMDPGLSEALVELCERGLLTCTSGRPGAANASYGLGWLPLDDAESFPEGVRRLHAQNMRRLGLAAHKPDTDKGTAK